MCVNEDGQFYHCFGCGESGDVITFIMKMEGMTFPEAVAFLAERAGMQVPTPVGFQVMRNPDKNATDCMKS